MDASHSSIKELMTFVSSLDAMLILLRVASLWLMVCGDALNETTVAAGALVGHNDIEERACFGTATGESDDDHDLSFGCRKDSSLESHHSVLETRDMTTRPATH